MTSKDDGSGKQQETSAPIAQRIKHVGMAIVALLVLIVVLQNTESV